MTSLGWYFLKIPSPTADLPIPLIAYTHASSWAPTMWSMELYAGESVGENF